MTVTGMARVMPADQSQGPTSTASSDAVRPRGRRGIVLAQPVSAQAPAYDLVLRNGRVVDGTGSPWQRADLAIRGDTIVRIAPSIPDRATRVIDVEGG